jgi:glutathione S-transferase
MTGVTSVPDQREARAVGPPSTPAEARSRRPAHLWTIPISHYCEKARWALDRARVPYVEHAHLPIFHRVASLPVSAGTALPVLKTADDQVLGNAADIVAWADVEADAESLFGEGPLRDRVQHLDARINESVGPAARRWAYFTFASERELALRHAATGAPRWQRRAFGAMYRFATRQILRALHADAERVAMDVELLDAWFDELDRMLVDGRPYLMGDDFTVVDLTWACLAAPVLLPPGYAVPLPQPEQLPDDAAARVRAWRARSSGQLVLRLFAARPKASRVRFAARRPTPPPS